ncbi:glycine zipper 2TM domain-containing protein [Sulfuricaulis sp.]|jgi:outer membrane lipoprotein SlyB|uniref:glycine zipper 2TM domain-containing protein n=1 Tax=Sulfuricaulis sp. TaxID=2003553 RepID=UPI0035596781
MPATEGSSSPIVKIAAVAVIIFAAVGVGMMTGIIPGAGSKNTAQEAAKECLNCGVIESINLVELKGEGSGAGAVAGGVLGAVVGSEIGAGRGKTLAEVAGAAGGAYAGNEVEKNMKKSAHFRITVRMNNGSVRTITQKTDPGFRTGDSVKIENGTLVRG